MSDRHDLLADRLDSLARLADTGGPDDRLRRIELRVQAARRRRTTAVAAVAAATVLAAALMTTAGWPGPWRGDAAPPVGGSPGRTPAPAPTPAPTASADAPGPPDSAGPTGPARPDDLGSVIDRQAADVDGDGRADRVTLFARRPDRAGGQWSLRVDSADGQRADAFIGILQADEATLDEPVDLDRDGDAEIVVGYGGGEFAQWMFFDGEAGAPGVDGDIGAIRTQDADTADLLPTGGVGGTDWISTLTANGLVDYRWLTADPGLPPFAVDFRRWVMTGQTLTRTATAQRGCFSLVDYRAVVTPGAC